MKSRFTHIFAALLVGLMSGCSLRHPISPESSITWQNEPKEWHQHFDPIALEAATPMTKKPPDNDPARNRISGVWLNRTNLNLWRHHQDAFVAQTQGVIHGYIDESNSNSIPRFTFVGDVWQADPQAREAKRQIKKAFAEWSSLQAGRSRETGLRLKTGLEFRLVAPTQSELNPRADIELHWNALHYKTAADTNRTLIPNGVTTNIRLTFNASNNWWFGKASKTPSNQMHFYSSALHEIGHIVGLWESNDPTSVMIFNRCSGPNGPAFDHIDEGSKRVASALYSIPVRKHLCPTMGGR